MVRVSVSSEKQDKQPSGAKTHADFGVPSARLKSCPETSCLSKGVFPQTVQTRALFDCGQRAGAEADCFPACFSWA